MQARLKTWNFEEDLTLTPTEFTPWAAWLGGCLIGLSAVLLMASHGRIAGISNIIARLMPPYGDHHMAGRFAFLLGLIAAPMAYTVMQDQSILFTVTENPFLLIGGGLLVGFGSVLGNGCTSGHGICGLSRFSKRSFVAVAVFVATAVSTVFIFRHVI